MPAAAARDRSSQGSDRERLTACARLLRSDRDAVAACQALVQKYRMLESGALDAIRSAMSPIAKDLRKMLKHVKAIEALAEKHGDVLRTTPMLLGRVRSSLERALEVAAPRGAPRRLMNRSRFIEDLAVIFERATGSPADQQQKAFLALVKAAFSLKDPRVDVRRALNRKKEETKSL